jgi:hypothetical protein
VFRSGLAYEDHAPTEDYDDPVLTIGGIEPGEGLNRLLPTCLVESSTNQGELGFGDVDGKSGGRGRNFEIGRILHLKFETRNLRLD